MTALLDEGASPNAITSEISLTDEPDAGSWPPTLLDRQQDSLGIQTIPQKERVSALQAALLSVEPSIAVLLLDRGADAYGSGPLEFAKCVQYIAPWFGFGAGLLKTADPHDDVFARIQKQGLVW